MNAPSQSTAGQATDSNPFEQEGTSGSNLFSSSNPFEQGDPAKLPAAIADIFTMDPQIKKNVFGWCVQLYLHAYKERNADLLEVSYEGCDEVGVVVLQCVDFLRMILDKYKYSAWANVIPDDWGLLKQIALAFLCCADRHRNIHSTIH